MTVRAAASRFLVAVLSLGTVVVSLVTAILRLLVTAIGRVTEAIERKAPEAPRPAPRLELVHPRPRAGTASAKETATAPTSPTCGERLTFALVGLGFKRGEVERFVASVGARVEAAPLPELIREGLAALTKAA